jgi:hypothetical protein
MLVIEGRREEAFNAGYPAQTHRQNSWQVSAIYEAQKPIPNGIDHQLLVR